jgi:hypothetical protein
MINKKPILITGSHRSGSTWVGKMISHHPSIGYIHEPFNPDYYPHQAGEYAAKLNYWFTYISKENENICLKEFQDTLAFNYSLSAAVKALFFPKMSYDLREPLRILRDNTLFIKNRILGARPLVKDPIALFSAEWMASKFNMDVVILIRHPAAFAGSLKLANWKFPFADFLEQPLLMKELLYPFQSEIEKLANNKHDIIDQACLLWNIIHYTILQYREKHQDWLFIRHEDLSQDPIDGFQEICAYLNLDYSQSLKQIISKYSNSKKDERNDNTEQVITNRAKKMNSKLNIKNWKNRLDDSEVIKIRERVEEISSQFYSDIDW